MTNDEIARLLQASPDDYWDCITSKVKRAATDVSHALLLNHEAAHLLAWANIARDAALTTTQADVEVTERLADAVEPLANLVGVNMNDPLRKWLTVGQIIDAKDALAMLRASQASKESKDDAT